MLVWSSQLNVCNASLAPGAACVPQRLMRVLSLCLSAMFSVLHFRTDTHLHRRFSMTSLHPSLNMRDCFTRVSCIKWSARYKGLDNWIQKVFSASKAVVNSLLSELRGSLCLVRPIWNCSPVSDAQTRTKVSVQGASAWPGHKEWSRCPGLWCSVSKNWIIQLMGPQVKEKDSRTSTVRGSHYIPTKNSNVWYLYTFQTYVFLYFYIFMQTWECVINQIYIVYTYVCVYINILT